MKKIVIAPIVLVAAACAGMGSMDSLDAQVVGMLKSSFKDQGQAKLDRLDQDNVQRECSRYNSANPLPKEVADRIEKEQLATIKYPADGLLGDWKSGERIAQSGIGKQYSDDPAAPTGGNCYACHQLTKAELSFGTIGPSLYRFGKLRGFTPEMQRYAYGKVYNSEAFSACSTMPRFGHSGILTEKQIKDVVALLMDPSSPVNQ